MIRFLIPSLLIFGLCVLPACSSPANDNDNSTGSGSGASTAYPEQLTGNRTFDVTHTITVPAPEDGGAVRVWMARPQTADEYQTVTNLKVALPDGFTQTDATDNEGNTHYYFEGEVAGESAEIVATFTVARQAVHVSTDASKTRAINDVERAKYKRYLESSQQEIIDDTARKIAAEVRTAAGDDNPIKLAKAAYDWVIANIDYWVKDPETCKSSGTGSSVYTLDKCTGNCTDIHSAYIVVLRAAGVPCRAVYGSFLKKPLDGVDKDQSYHCWVEFLAPNIGWVPLDVAVADLYVGSEWLTDSNRELSELTTATGDPGENPQVAAYYFGNLEPRRVVWHRGRDLVLDPKQDGAPLLWLPKAYAEHNGAALAGVGRKLTYREVTDVN